MPKENKFTRGQLHIFVDNPTKYSPIMPEGVDCLNVLVTYDDTKDALLRGDKLVCTTQLAFLSHLWIKAGYDITLYTDGYTIVFDDYYTYITGLNEVPMSYYFMQDLLKMGDLYQTPLDD